LVLWGLTALALWMNLPRPVPLGGWVLGALLGLLLVAAGLAAAAPFGKGAPLLAVWTRPARPVRQDVRLLAGSFLVGLALGALLLGLIVFALLPLEPKLAVRLAARLDYPAWWPFAVAFEASVLEEIVFRLFLLSATVWLLGRGWRKDRKPASPAVVWAATGVSALAFALVHLPSWTAVTSPTPLLVSCVLGLNAIAGVVFGRVYWRWGIEAAIACHYAADLIVQSLGPRLVG